MLRKKTRSIFFVFVNRSFLLLHLPHIPFPVVGFVAQMLFALHAVLFFKPWTSSIHGSVVVMLHTAAAGTYRAKRLAGTQNPQTQKDNEKQFFFHKPN